MKKFLLLLLPIVLNAQADISFKEVDWLTDYERALKEAVKQEKNVLVYFTGSDWCPPCKMLKKDFFETEAFSKLSEDYILLYIDLPRKRNLLSSDQLLHNQQVLKKLNKKGVFPLLKILNKNEKVLGEISGYNMDGNTKKHLKFIEKHKA